MAKPQRIGLSVRFDKEAWIDLKEVAVWISREQGGGMYERREREVLAAAQAIRKTGLTPPQFLAKLRRLESIEQAAKVRLRASGNVP